jgi:hypothetical protein
MVGVRDEQLVRVLVERSGYDYVPENLAYQVAN